MSRMMSTFLERLAERLTALVAGLVSARVAGLQATLQADQQSQLEDLARQYEADGKTEIAATLRARAARLTAVDLAGEAPEIFLSLVHDPAPRSALGEVGGAPLPALPDWSGPPPKPRSPRSAPRTPPSAANGQEIA